MSFNLLDQNTFSQGDGYMRKNGNVVPRVVYVARACVQNVLERRVYHGGFKPPIPPWAVEQTQMGIAE